MKINLRYQDVFDVAITLVFFGMVFLFSAMFFSGRPVPKPSEKDKKYIDSLTNIVNQRNELIQKGAVDL